MTNQQKLIKKLRVQDHKDFGTPFQSYSPFEHTTWFDRLSKVKTLNDQDLAFLYKYGQ